MSVGLRSFLDKERETAGWRFWLLWVVATSIGYFPGMLLAGRLGHTVGALFALPTVDVIPATVGAIVLGTFVGIAQGIVLRRHYGVQRTWASATTVGGAVGALIASWALEVAVPSLWPTDPLWLVVMGFLAGAVAGVPQWLVLRGHNPSIGPWWVLVSSIGWGTLNPGAITGAALALTMRERWVTRRSGG